jgi:hypothetical protein
VLSRDGIREVLRGRRYGGPVSDVPPGTADTIAAWGIPSQAESRVAVLCAIVAAIFLQVILPDRLLLNGATRIVVPALEALLLVVLLIVNPTRTINPEERALRAVGIALIALISLANVVSLIALIHALLYGAKAGGRTLVYASVPIWLTNVIAFGLWYWELDRGGPAVRCQPTHRRPDFLFPQMGARGADPGWTPNFGDYLYTSFTNATAFSPTDTMPLTSWAKLLMALQSLASLITLAVVISRAVNILA